MCGNNAFWYGRHFHSIKPLYTHWWIGQAIFYGLAGWMADALPIVVVCCMGATPAAEESRDFLRVCRKVLRGGNKTLVEQYGKVLPPGQTDVSVTSSAADFSRNTKFF